MDIHRKTLHLTSAEYETSWNVYQNWSYLGQLNKQSSTNFKWLRSYTILSQTRATGLEQKKTLENLHVHSERNKRGIKISINEGSNGGTEKHKRHIENK